MEALFGITTGENWPIVLSAGDIDTLDKLVPRGEFILCMESPSVVQQKHYPAFVLHSADKEGGADTRQCVAVRMCQAVELYDQLKLTSTHLGNMFYNVGMHFMHHGAHKLLVENVKATTLMDPIFMTLLEKPSSDHFSVPPPRGARLPPLDPSQPTATMELPYNGSQDDVEGDVEEESLALVPPGLFVGLQESVTVEQRQNFFDIVYNKSKDLENHHRESSRQVHEYFQESMRVQAQEQRRTNAAKAEAESKAAKDKRAAADAERATAREQKDAARAKEAAARAEEALIRQKRLLLRETRLLEQYPTATLPPLEDFDEESMEE
jgi:hypothetical protein